MLNLEMSLDDFKKFKDFIFKRSGISYSENKKIILQNRIRRRLRALNIESYSEYFEIIKDKNMNHEEIIKFFDEVTTNETSFFRHERQFEALKTMIIPELLKERTKKDIEVWSAAASMGKEAYTIAMVLKSMHELSSYKIKILGTDLNQKVLDLAKQGEYDAKDVKDVPAEYKKYFTEDKVRGIVTMKDELKNAITFKRYNLKDSFSSFPTMDIIFCRNVFIYFPKEVQKEIVKNFYDKLSLGGFFVLGHSETLNGISDDFTYRKFNNENLMIYQKTKK